MNNYELACVWGLVKNRRSSNLEVMSKNNQMQQK